MLNPSALRVIRRSSVGQRPVGLSSPLGSKRRGMSASVPQRANLFLLLVWIATPGCARLLAQVDRGAIVGAVSDASGAVVPGASVTITNTATNQTVHISTDASGYYEAPLFRIVTYTVTTEKEAFLKMVRPDVEVGVNQVVRVDLALQVGATTQTVEVKGAPPLVQTETSSLGTVETARRVVDLPLNGRNFIQLAYLGPGANAGQQGSNVSGGVFENERANEALSINGLRVSNNNFLLNGVDNNEFGLGGVVALPPPDAIQEFRTEENAMSAEFGRGGAAVNVAVKSGTNEIHGGLYEFIRNDVLDARNFFDQNQADLTTGAQVPGTARPPFRRNQFGFFAGGPIRKDKTFIFGDYQGTRIREGLTNLDTVPTNAERGGDFSDRLGGANFSPCGDLGQIGASDPVYDTGTIFNPFPTRNFTCSNGTVVLLRDPLSSNGRLNVIPPNLINAVGQNVINLYPTATLPGITNNLLLNPSQSNDQDSFDVHFDNRFSDRDQFFVSYSYGSVRSILPGPLGILGGGDCCPSNSKDGNQHAGTGWTHSFNAALLNDLHGGYFRYRVTGQPLNFGKALGQQLGIPNANRGDPTSSGLPNFDVSGYTGMGDSLWTPEFAVENIYQLADTVTWLRGRHSLKLGVDFRRQQRNFFQVTAPRGWYSFDGQYTQDLTTANGGNGLADLLLGPPNFF